MSCIPLLYNLFLPPSFPPLLPTPKTQQQSKKIDAGLASRYGDPGDKYETFNQPYACYGSLTRKWGKSKYKEAKKLGVAHRSLPCGTSILICKLKRCTPGIVIDRGPYGALDQTGKWHVRSRLQPGERWRGVIDLSPPVANALGIDGLSSVKIYLTGENK